MSHPGKNDSTLLVSTGTFQSDAFHEVIVTESMVFFSPKSNSACLTDLPVVLIVTGIIQQYAIRDGGLRFGFRGGTSALLITGLEPYQIPTGHI